MSKILGNDALLQDRRLVPTASGDIALVSGPANLEQALKHRIRTAIGGHKYHLEYGSNIPDMISKPNTDILRSMIYVEIAKICDAEPRVDRIVKLEISELNPKSIVIDLEARVIDRSNPRNLLLRMEVNIG